MDCKDDVMQILAKYDQGLVGKFSKLEQELSLNPGSREATEPLRQEIMLDILGLKTDLRVNIKANWKATTVE